MELNIDLSHFKVFHSPTLFDLETKDFYAILKEKRCIYCSNKLVFMRNGKTAYCKSKKHKQRFFISVEKLNHINGE